MPNSYNEFTGDNVEDDFTITYSYLDPDHLVVLLDGVEQTKVTHWDLSSAQVVTFVTPPGTDVAILIKRISSRATALVDFTNGAMLTGDDLNTSHLQNFYLHQEILDGITLGDLEAIIINEISSDLSPVLGGQLDTAGWDINVPTGQELDLQVNDVTVLNLAAAGVAITGTFGVTGATSLTGTLGVTGDLTVGNFVFNAAGAQGAGQDNYVLTYDHSAGKIGLEAAVAEVNDLSAAVTWANVPDANITEGSVTQHQAALSVTESQISDLGTYVGAASIVSQVDAEAGVGTTAEFWTPVRVKQAIDALAPAGGVAGAKAFGASNQAITTATETAILFASESYDTASVHDLVTNNSRLTVPAGVTRIRLTGHVQWAANGSAMRTLRIRRDGSNANTLDDAMAGCTPVNYMSAAGASVEVHGQDIDSGVITVTATDYFELVVEQTSGGNLNLLAGDYWFQMEIIT